MKIDHRQQLKELDKHIQDLLAQFPDEEIIQLEEPDILVQSKKPLESSE